MVANGGIATVGKSAGASVAYARHVVGVAAEKFPVAILQKPERACETSEKDI